MEPGPGLYGYCTVSTTVYDKLYMSFFFIQLRIPTALPLSNKLQSTAYGDCHVQARKREQGEGNCTD